MKELVGLLVGAVEVYGWATGGASVVRLVFGLGLPHVAFIILAIGALMVVYLKWKNLDGGTESYRRESWMRGQC